MHTEFPQVRCFHIPRYTLHGVHANSTYHAPFVKWILCTCQYRDYTTSQQGGNVIKWFLVADIIFFYIFVTNNFFPITLCKTLAVFHVSLQEQLKFLLRQHKDALVCHLSLFNSFSAQSWLWNSIWLSNICRFTVPFYSSWWPIKLWKKVKLSITIGSLQWPISFRMKTNTILLYLFSIFPAILNPLRKCLLELNWSLLIWARTSQETNPILVHSVWIITDTSQ